MWFRSVLDSWKSASPLRSDQGIRRGKPCRPRRCHLEIEVLEDRLTPSRSGLEFSVNTEYLKNQYESANASSLNGRSVVVWTHRFSSTDTDIRAQVYDDAGNRVGSEIHVANGTKNESQPAVAMNGRGDFVVVWTEDYTSSDKDIKAARFAADGTKLGNTFRVAGDTRNEYQPAVAMAGNGNFVVSYTLDFSTTDQDLWGKLYRFGDGSLVRSFLVSNGFSNEHSSSVAAAGTTFVSSPNFGRFLIAFQLGNDVRVRKFLADASNSQDVGEINIPNRLEGKPSISMDYWGNAVVAYQAKFAANTGWDVMTRRIDEFGVLGPENTLVQGILAEPLPAVAIDPWNGRVVATYQVNSSSGGSRLWVLEVSASGTATAGYSPFSYQSGTRPAVSVSGNHRYLVTYTSRVEVSSYGTDIYGQWGVLI
jgi:hypothetical protein